MSSLLRRAKSMVFWIVSAVSPGRPKMKKPWVISPASWQIAMASSTFSTLAFLPQRLSISGSADSTPKAPL